MTTIDTTMRRALAAAALAAASTAAFAQNADLVVTTRAPGRDPAPPPGVPVDLVQGNPLPVLVQRVAVDPPAPPGPPMREVTVTPEALALILGSTGPEPRTLYLLAPSSRSR